MSIDSKKIDIKLILDSSNQPPAFSPGEKLFWNHPHISQQMLAAHLTPDLDVASYNHKTVDMIVEWLASYLKLKKGDKVLDIGCGPGLYCSRLCRHGFDVTGMDYSKNSINYAVNYAKENNLQIEYIYQDYLTMNYTDIFDAIFLIYYDFGVLSNTSRSQLLKNIHSALKPGGFFVFDVLTKNCMQAESNSNWHAYNSGFWRPHPHIVLEQSFYYGEECAHLRQYTIIEEDGDISVYRCWDAYYSVDSITQVLEEHGFSVQDVWSDLTGKSYEEGTKSLGIVAKKSELLR